MLTAIRTTYAVRNVDQYLTITILTRDVMNCAKNTAETYHMPRHDSTESCIVDTNSGLDMGVLKKDKPVISIEESIKEHLGSLIAL